LSELAEIDKQIRKYYSEKKYPELVSYIEPFLKKYPKNDAIYYHLAHGLLMTKQFDNALEQIQKAIAIEPKKSIYYALLGDIFIYMKNNEKALEAYKKQLDLNPYNITIIDELYTFLSKNNELNLWLELFLYFESNFSKKKKFDKNDNKAISYLAFFYLQPKTLDRSVSYYIELMNVLITYRKNNKEFLDYLEKKTKFYIEKITEVQSNYFTELHTKLNKKNESDLGFGDAILLVLVGYYYELKGNFREGHKTLGFASKIAKKQKDTKLTELFTKIVMTYLFRNEEYLQDFTTKKGRPWKG
jgi:tetratricopeptide (TPR) repeat protein